MRLIRYNQPYARGYAPVLRGQNRSPWAGLESEIDRLFSSTLGDFVGASSTRFPVDLYEDKDNAYVRAELPGINRDDIHIEMVDGYLTINAQRKSKNGDNEQSFEVNRSVSLPDSVAADKVGATYENGVLTVTLPKREEAKPKKITVAVK
ncbi:MAG: Hsp20/alpha crystallin family protein [Cephaloticoccus sp.]|jgi:HSP20 family protein|nr:Hsp20/alpha crystallin family protein [Cephaloticoccus sp.]MCF7758921.1 Hsp20/alpha crystallin family protein [Cephaloticoccus sp.]